MLRTLLIVLFVGLIPVSAHADIRLLVNGQDIKTVSLAGEEVHLISVAASNPLPKSYSLELGFLRPDGSLGTFKLNEVKSEAGIGASAVRSLWPDFSGFTLTSGTGMIEGIHFIFDYKPTEIGTTRLVLFETATQDLIDFVDITVTDPVTGRNETGMFNYQGRLNDAGSPAEGLYDMQFSLFADATHVHFGQVGPMLEFTDIDVVDGYFMVDLDFGDDPNILNGHQRYLQIAIRPGGTSDDFETLTPRQRLLPAPYAVHALDSQAQLATLQAQVEELTALLAGVSRDENTLLFEGMNLQVVSGSGNTQGTVNGLGNIIIGYDEDPVTGTPDKSGSHNLVVGQGHTYSSYGGIVGGAGNTVSGDNASVLGGLGNEADGTFSVVAGGAGNLAAVARSAILGGASNSANYRDSAVVGGRYGQANGNYSVVVGGGNIDSAEGNVAEGDYSVVVGGRDNTATGDRSVVVGGSDNQTSGNNSVIGGGTNNQTTADATVVSGGHNLNADSPFEILTGRKPAYDSGWVAKSYGTTTYAHMLGGDIDDYVVELSLKYTGPLYTNGVHIAGLGGNTVSTGLSGIYWEGLTDTTIKVTRGSADGHTDEIRIRIWIEK